MNDKLEELRKASPEELEQAIARARITRPHQLYPYQEIAIRIEGGLPIALADDAKYILLHGISAALYSEVLEHGVERVWTALAQIRGG